MTTKTELAAHLCAGLGESIRSKAPVFRLPQGIHEVAGGHLPERYCHTSNNDQGLKRILFDIEGAENLVLEGAGSTLMMSGEVIPIRVGNSRSITLRNLTIDWRRPAYTQAVVEHSELGCIEFSYDPSLYPLGVDRGRLIARDGEGWQTDFLWNLLPYHPHRREVSSKNENWQISRWHRATTPAEGRIRIEADFREIYAPGTPIVLMHGNRVAPGIWVEESCGVTLENVIIHHAPAMGVLAQCSRDVSLRQVRVEPSGDRLFSTWVDAVHFVECHGHTLIEGCRLSGQFDDAVNIHAAFYKIVSHSAGRSMRVQTIHPQRFGPCGIKSGDGVAIYRRATMQRIAVGRAASVVPLNQEFHDIELAEAIPLENDCIIRRYEPGSANRIEITHNNFGANRGRGILINMEHPTLIEGNHFHVSGRAIESIPDANYWWEAGPFEELVVRGNTFEDCNYGPCGDTLIHVGPELPDGSDPRKGAFHQSQGESLAVLPTEPVLKNLIIEKNTIIRHSSSLLFAQSVDGLVFEGNTITDSTAYPMRDTGPAIQLGSQVRNSRVQAV